MHIFFSKTLQQFMLSNKEAILDANRYQRGRSKVGFNLRSKPQMAALRKPMTRFGGIFLPENSCFCSFGLKMGEYFTFHLTVLITMITTIFETIAQIFAKGNACALGQCKSISRQVIMNRSETINTSRQVLVECYTVK